MKYMRRFINEATDYVFNVKELSGISSFKGRYKYCIEHLGSPIGRGSGRVVFQIDDYRVLKLALNQKGQAQNEVEITNGNGQGMYSGLFPMILQCDKYDDNWIVSEYVLPAKVSDFPEVVGVTFKEFCQFVKNSYRFNVTNGKLNPAEHEKFIDYLDNNEELHEVDMYIADYQIPTGDLTRISSWGISDRFGDACLVLLDNGLNDEVLNKYYR